MKDGEVIPHGEMWPCFVGSGECKIPARFFIDDGTGKFVGVCADHKIEFDRIEKAVSEMEPEQVLDFARAVAKAEGVPVSEVLGE